MRKKTSFIFASACAVLLLGGCAQPQESSSDKGSPTVADTNTSTSTATSGGQNEADKGKEIGSVFEAYLSPQQEGGEESDTPKQTPSKFKSTAPSRTRDARKDHGHGKLKFTKDLSKAIIEVEVADVNIADVNMFHIHCGRPSMLGPIGIDFSLSTDIQKNFNDDGVLAIEITNDEIEAVVNSATDVVGAFTLGCPIFPGSKDKFTTIGGMEYLAREGDLYFNLHTNGQTYFGDMRGQLRQIDAADDTDPIDVKVAPKDAPKPSGESHGMMMHH